MPNLSVANAPIGRSIVYVCLFAIPYRLVDVGDQLVFHNLGHVRDVGPFADKTALSPCLSLRRDRHDAFKLRVRTRVDDLCDGAIAQPSRFLKTRPWCCLPRWY